MQVKIEVIDDAGVAMLVKNDERGVLVINVWATWCGPCIAELPEFVTIQRMYRGRGLRVVTISMDEPEKRDAVLDVLKKNHVSGTNYILKTESRDKFADILDKEWKGPVPYTLVVAPGGKVLYRKLNEMDPLALKRAIVDFIGRTY